MTSIQLNPINTNKRTPKTLEDNDFIALKAKYLYTCEKLVLMIKENEPPFHKQKTFPSAIQKCYQSNSSLKLFFKE